MNTPAYSTLISCLYDEPHPIGKLGRGVHYSIFRTVEWLDILRQPLILPEIHDFSVIWDEDHDTRIIPVIEAVYMSGHFSPIQFIGERKGTLTILVAAKFFFDPRTEMKAYTHQLQTIADNSCGGDSWPLEVGMFDRSLGSPHQTNPCGIIQDDEVRSITYLRNIDSLWSLGTKPYRLHNDSSLNI